MPGATVTANNVEIPQTRRIDRVLRDILAPIEQILTKRQDRRALEQLFADGIYFTDNHERKRPFTRVDSRLWLFLISMGLLFRIFCSRGLRWDENGALHAEVFRFLRSHALLKRTNGAHLPREMRRDFRPLLLRS
jgi:hypothetical protein